MIVWTHLLCLDGQEEFHTGPDILDKKGTNYVALEI